MRGDREKVAAYARQLADRLREAGDENAANAITRLLNGKAAKTAGLARGGRLIEIEPVPVDSESRLPVGDVELIERDVFLRLDGDLSRRLARFIECYRKADQLNQNGVGIAPTLLVHGPPGCGKTQMARFVAKEFGLPLVTARADSLISSYLGSTAKNIRSLFHYAAAQPCVLFLDELDALAKMRDDTHELGELKRVVISLLQNIDALSSDHVLVAATNHAHLLDPAVWRRFTCRLELPFPNAEARRDILSHFFSGGAEEDTVEKISALTDGLSGAHLQDIAEESVRGSILDGKANVSLPRAVQMALEHIDHSARDDESKMRLILERAHPPFSKRTIAKMLGLSQSTTWRILSQIESENGRSAG